MVMVFDANAAVTPAGNPVAVPIPVAPVVAWVIFVSTVFTKSVGVVEAAPAVFTPDTVIVNVLPVLTIPLAFLTIIVPV